MKKRLFSAMAALVMTTLSFAQEYMVIENHYGGIARYDVSLIKQATFKTFESAGAGTAEAPFNVAAANAKCKEAGETPSSEQYYVKGLVYSVQRLTGGRVTFYIADDMSGINRLYAYEVTCPVSELKPGDEVVVFGSLYNYNSTSPEMTGDIVAVNGQAYEPATPQGTGTLDDPFNVAAAIAKCKELGETASTEDYYIKGKVAKVQEEFTTTYGNGSFTISDDGSEAKVFYAYRVLYLGNKKFTAGDTQIKVGDDVIICGKIINYRNNTPETVQTAAYLYSLNGVTDEGQGGEQPEGAKGTGTEADPFNVAAAIAKCKEVGQTASTESYYIKGIADAEYTVDNYKNVTVNLVDAEGASEKFTVYRVKDKDGKGIKPGYKIAKGATIIVYGPVVNYKGNTPETATGAYLVSVDGQAPEVEDEGQGGEQGGETATTLTNGDFETWANGLPTGWKSASTASSATLEQSTDAHGGSYSCIVKGDEGSNKRLASQEITLAAGSYTFSFWVKPTTTDVAQVRPAYVPVTDGSVGSYKYGDYATLAAGWQQVSYDFTLDAETTVCLVVMNPKKSSYSSGKDVLIDDATLVKK